MEAKDHQFIFAIARLIRNKHVLDYVCTMYMHYLLQLNTATILSVKIWLKLLFKYRKIMILSLLPSLD